MNPETNEKVLAMYRAVLELVDEGCDIHKIKVADITARAGIGKGTAYEYFRSKEEIVERALRYDFLMQFQILEKQVEDKKSLHDAVKCCFDWMETRARRSRLGRQLMQKTGFCAGDEKECRLDDGDCRVEYAERILHYMVQVGKKDGSIHPDIPLKLAAIQIFSQLAGFFLICKREKKWPDRELSVVKEFLYSNMEKGLKNL